MKNKLLQLIQAYQEMADFTLADCRDYCKTAYSCCSAEYCKFTVDYAFEKYNIKLLPASNGPIPFIGPQGCVVPPYLRPVCTVHHCDINSVGFKKNCIEWTEKYYELRERISLLEDENYRTNNI